MTYEKHFSVLDKLMGDVSKEMKKDALAIDRAVVLATPVDTGRARANWIVSNASPANKSSLETGAQAALSQGESAIRGHRGLQTIFIQNNLAYIERLNDGYSKQAPSKYIDVILERVANA